MPPLSREIPPPTGTPLIKRGRGDRHPPYQGRSPRLPAPPLSRGAGGIKPPLLREIPPPTGTPLIKGGRGDQT
ncbi:MAG: hypothetical protein DWQ56_14580 [Microcystis aeruginosa DA14]|uniref:Uncharacterized protein n=1 Tax=Microcystis aeruginosa DA14 TaxID=1987506 RepID=A0A3E0M6U3_MICAE|nr:MAG: hypothetical protein DWQ56_14580 [Microcystis aeruginosa DA14]